MHGRSIRTVLLPVAIVLALVTPPPSHAAAAWPVSLSGYIDVGSSNPRLDLLGDEEDPCPTFQSIDMSFSGNDVSGTWELTGDFVMPFQVSGNPSWYHADVTVMDSSIGTYSGGPGADLAGRVDLRMVLSSLAVDDWPFECQTTVECTVLTRTILGPVFNHHVGTLPTPAAWDWTEIDSSSARMNGIASTAVGGSCPVTLQNAMVNKTVEAYLLLEW